MEAVEQIGFEDIITHISDLGHINFSQYQDKIMMFDLDRQKALYHKHRGLPLKLDSLCIIMIERGECVFKIDYRPFHVVENMAIVLSNRHIIQFVSVSDNFKSCNLFVARNFPQTVLNDTKIPLPTLSGVSFFSNPVIRLEPEEFSILRNNLERLRSNIHRNDHVYWSNLVQNELANLFFEIRNMMLLRLGREPEKQKYAYREQVISRFFQLIFEYSRTEREVSFYADKLCVTPVYLSRAVKRIIGNPAVKIIHEMAIIDAMALLRKPDMTIQDASDIMNFPDRETFSKFFKNVAGEWPGEYRKKVRGKK